jgi:TIR domain
MPSMVFISHSSKDRETADAICAHLESIGINCWIAPLDLHANRSEASRGAIFHRRQ